MFICGYRRHKYERSGSDIAKSGYKVTGSDISDSNLISRLRKNGAKVSIPHNPNVETAELVVYTAAVSRITVK